MNGVDIFAKLSEFRGKHGNEGEHVLHEVNRILNREMFSEKNILHNLRNYNKLIEVLDEEDLEHEFIFKPSDIKSIALKYRLRFLDSQSYRFEFPYEAVLKIDYLNHTHKKSIKGFKLLGTGDFFSKEKNNECALLFAPTNHGNYYLIHRWGRELKWYREYASWPLKNIETLLATVIFITLIVTLSLPIRLITLDSHATYWSGWRLGVFFHLLIFNMGFTTYFTFAFSRGLTVSNWNRGKDFG
jgi:hypothetical protein